MVVLPFSVKVMVDLLSEQPDVLLDAYEGVSVLMGLVLLAKLWLGHTRA